MNNKTQIICINLRFDTFSFCSHQSIPLLDGSSK